MSVSIPNLWGDKLRPPSVSPTAVLRAQAGLLEEVTDGILEGEGEGERKGRQIELHLDMVAPSLERYRIRLLTVRHLMDRPYPVTVESAFFPAPPPPRPAGKRNPRGDPHTRQAADHKAFLELLRSILQSDEVQKLAQSLIARSNDTSQVTDPFAGAGVPGNGGK